MCVCVLRLRACLPSMRPLQPEPASMMAGWLAGWMPNRSGPPTMRVAFLSPSLGGGHFGRLRALGQLADGRATAELTARCGGRAAGHESRASQPASQLGQAARTAVKTSRLIGRDCWPRVARRTARAIQRPEQNNNNYSGTRRRRRRRQYDEGQKLGGCCCRCRCRL